MVELKTFDTTWEVGGGYYFRKLSHKIKSPYLCYKVVPWPQWKATAGLPLYTAGWIVPHSRDLLTKPGQIKHQTVRPNRWGFLGTEWFCFNLRCHRNFVMASSADWYGKYSIIFSWAYYVRVYLKLLLGFGR